jgi:hypothetical protein
MKKIVAALAICFLSVAAVSAQNPVYTDATQLTLTGKLFYDTPNPYHRVDTVRFKGFTVSENVQVRCSAGLAVLFRTDAPEISIRSEMGYRNNASNTMGIALRGFDLYIRTPEGRWQFAASKEGKDKGEVKIISHMDRSMKECMLYLPMYSELYSLEVGVPEGCVLEALPSPFRHRIGIFGSSFTQGISISRTGMSYPDQFTRDTGIQMLSLGCSGNCKLQPYFAEVLKAADVDALVFDAFSNPAGETIRERLFPFIESIQEAHPDIPLIFMQTIHRCSTHYDLDRRQTEQAKQDAAEELMKEACKKYKNVYFIHPCANDKYHETSVDGTHPDDYGYTLWARSIEKPILRILRKYGLK